MVEALLLPSTFSPWLHFFFRLHGNQCLDFIRTDCINRHVFFHPPHHHHPSFNHDISSDMFSRKFGAWWRVFPQKNAASIFWLCAKRSCRGWAPACFLLCGVLRPLVTEAFLAFKSACCLLRASRGAGELLHVCFHVCEHNCSSK